jgi:MFS family permease
MNKNSDSAVGYAGVIALIAIGKVIFGTDFGAVNVALATIAKELSIAPSIMSWVVATYSLTYAGFLVLGGRVADCYGRRRFCILGLVLFGAGSIVACAAVNVWMLIAARAVEGLGSAFFIPASFSLINVLLPDGPVKHRGFAVFSATQGVAMVLGLAGGGILTTMASWRAVFLINLPLVIAAILLAWRFIPPYERSARPQKLDLAGAVLITACPTLLLTGISALGALEWSRGLIAVVASGVILAGFVALERRLEQPLVPPNLYRYDNFMGGNIGSVGAMAATGGLFVLLNLYMQRMLHFSALQSGVGMLPYALAVMAGGHLIGRLMARYPLRRCILAGFGVFITATLLFATVSVEHGYALGVAPTMIVVGLGSTVAAILLMALATSAVPARLQGVATGTLITFQQIGLALGISVCLAVMTAASRSGASSIETFHDGFLATTVMAALGLGATLALTRRTIGRVPSNEVALAEPG